MKPEDLKQARKKLGLTLAQMGRLLGYSGPHAYQQVHKMESGARSIKNGQERLVTAYLSGYRPSDWPL